MNKNNSKLPELNEYNLEWRQLELRSLRLPSIRSNTTAIIMNNDLVIFGGKGSNQFNEIWKFSNNKLIWELIEVKGNDIPLPRDGHTITKINETKFYIFGGQGHVMGNKIYEKQTDSGKAKCLSIRKLFDDFYEFDFNTLTWSQLPRRKFTPPGRRGHTIHFIKPNFISSLLSSSSSSSSINENEIIDDKKIKSSHFHNINGYLLLFGGSCVDLNSSVERTNNDMWLYNLDTYDWEQIKYHGPPPLPVYGHSAEIIDKWFIVIGGNVTPPSIKKVPKVNYINYDDTPHTNHNTVSIFDLVNFQWSHILVNFNIPSFTTSLSTTHFGLNLIGHSTLRSPINQNDIWIFGGRKTDEINLSDDEIIVERNQSAPIYSLNIVSMEITQLRLHTPQQFLQSHLNSPESRLNQVFIRLHEDNLDFNPIINTIDSNSENQLPTSLVPIRRYKLPSEQPIIRVYGGSKLYDSGFCNGDIYDLYFVPNLNINENELKQQDELTSENSIEENSSNNSQTFLTHNNFHDSDNDDDDNNSITTEDGQRNHNNHNIKLTHNNNNTPHRLQLKENSSVRLLAPKSGIEGKYFLLKTELTNSKSTFTTDNLLPGIPQRNSSIKSLQSLPQSHSHSQLSSLSSQQSLSPSISTSTSLSPLRTNSRVNRHNSNLSPLSLSPVSSPQKRSPTKSKSKDQNKARLQNLNIALSPIAKGIPRHEARDIFHELYSSQNNINNNHL